MKLNESILFNCFIYLFLKLHKELESSVTCCLAHWESTGDFLLLQIYSDVCLAFQGSPTPGQLIDSFLIHHGVHYDLFVCP